MEIGRVIGVFVCASLVVTLLLGGCDSSLIEFHDMIECATGRGSWEYNGYGCWCGIGGKGEPLDGTDSCCKEHDKCWDALLWKNDPNGPCGKGTVLQFETYRHEKDNCDPDDSSEYSITCAETTESSGWLSWLTNFNRNNECEKALCECDRQAADCFHANEGTFNSNYAFYPNNRC